MNAGRLGGNNITIAYLFNGRNCEKPKMQTQRNDGDGLVLKRAKTIRTRTLETSEVTVVEVETCFFNKVPCKL